MTSPDHTTRLQADTPIDCTVYRCSRQDAMYVYLRAELSPETLPEPLRRQTGRLTEVMRLTLDASRRLANADAAAVVARLRESGWYLQLPPQGGLRAHLHFGD